MASDLGTRYASPREALLVLDPDVLGLDESLGLYKSWQLAVEYNTFLLELNR